MEVEKDIKDSLHKCGIRRDVDVGRLNLASKKLTGVPDLSRFHFLRELRLNNNKSISGTLNHLTCLRLLFLHNNQIRGLEDTMHELRRMQQLQTATFFLNPISHEPGYRHHVIHCLPSIQVLDRKEVKSAERRRSFQMYNQERHHVLQSVAFGRRAP
uniref:leucine-rich repeat-containing protein 72 isoform X2 n=1 Tax=Scatophagus argus TaxID=75038 RepID=UPI001ED7D37F|nr:leucine-rich repeat-containing protein 72 isoform X2 [Scatophagus argus]